MNTCPVCQKTSRGIHFKTCGRGKDSEDFKYEVYTFSHKELCKENLKLLKELYYEKQLSVTEIKNFCKSHQFNIPNHDTVKFLLRFNGFHYRDQSEAAKLDRVRGKYERTCIKKYGVKNTLSKNSPFYEKRNKTVKEKYGVDNVFQIRRIIEQIQCKTKGNKSILAKESWNRLTDEEKYNRLKKTILKSPSFLVPNRIESAVAQSLLTNQVPFKFSHFIENRQFDFLIFGKVLIEVQGDFWHANPSYYRDNNVLNFPGNKKKIAKELWEGDRKKLELVEKLGYIVIYLWEDEIKKSSSDEIMQLIKLRLLEKDFSTQDT
jgi:G:T-mismatch repair DNA endonuclease (very short patch repair protein)